MILVATIILTCYLVLVDEAEAVRATLRQAGFRPAPPPSDFGYEAAGGREALEMKLRLQGVRDLHAAIFRVAQAVASRSEIRHACLIARVPRITADRLAREWGAVRGLFRPEIARRLALVVLGLDPPWISSDEPRVRRLAESLHRICNRPAARTGPSGAGISRKFFEVFKIALHQWLRNRGPIPIAALQDRSGCSYPTVAESIRALESSGELVRHSNRSVELRGFPQETWGRVLALSSSLRRPAPFADLSGRAPDLKGLLRRIREKAPTGIGVGGVLAGRHWDPDFDLHGVPRLDLCLHASNGTYDLDFVTRIDPALRADSSRTGRVVLVIHPLLRARTLFEEDRAGRLPWSDPVETLLDLHELRLVSQAQRLIARLRSARTG